MTAMTTRVVYLLVVTFINLMECIPSEETSTRSSTIQENRKRVSSPTKVTNLTNENILLNILDVRTPPRIKLKQDKMKYENSHPGVAIPVDEDLITLDESTTKKFNFYKIERPTTDSSISTWILLSSQSLTSTKPSIANSTSKVVTDLLKDGPIVPIYSRITKPTAVIESPTVNKDKVKFTEINKTSLKNKKKPTYTTSTVVTSSTEAADLKKAEDKHSTTKDKKKTNAASTTMSSSTMSSSTGNADLNKANNGKTTLKSRKKLTQTTSIVSSTESIMKNEVVSPVTPNVSLDESFTNSSSVTNSSSIALESKDGSVTLATDKKKTTSSKKKKNKRRRKPSNKVGTSVNTTTKIKNKNGAIGSQLYNYLSREIVPTLGVGLVGLMVTAGLASYFLYPFGIARRSSDIDRKDKDNYYYKDEYSGGMLEEEAIGQVIAGMPANYLSSSSLKSSRPKNTYLNKLYRTNTQPPIQYNQPYQTFSKESSDGVSALFEREDNKKFNEENEDKSNDQINDNKRFVVGSVQKEEIEEVTPVAVPEHGPRSLELFPLHKYSKVERSPRMGKIINFSKESDKKTN